MVLSLLTPGSRDRRTQHATPSPASLPLGCASIRTWRTRSKLAAVGAGPFSSPSARSSSVLSGWGWSSSRSRTPGRRRRPRPSRRRGSSRRRPPPASRTPTTASSSSSWAAAWPPSTATTTGSPSSTSRAASTLPLCTTTTAPRAGRCAFSALPDPATDLAGVTGAYPIDVDGDGAIDLAVLRSGENVVLRGLGGCRFDRANEAWGIDGGGEWTAAFSAAWEGDADLPTLAFGNYVAADAIDAARDLCADNILLRPDGGTGRYADPVALAPGFCTLSILFSDWDRSGERDLRMANDRHYYRDGHEQLWRIRAGAEPAEYTEADGWKTMLIWGMGIASQDLTGDGRPEVFLTSQGDNKLQTLDEDATGPSYHDMALELGATAHRPFTGGDVLPSTAWHPEFADVNNDGYMDLFISKGNVEAMNEYAAKDPNNLLIGQPDGTFVEGAEAADLLDFARSRGAALVDLNLDGLLDLVVVERREHAKVWRNVGAGDAATPAAMGHWVAVGLSQPGAERRRDRGLGRGARRRPRGQARADHRGGHASGQLGWIHFGIGEADRAEVRVQWPDGEVGPWIPLRADELVTVERGELAATPWASGT